MEPDTHACKNIQLLSCYILPQLKIHKNSK